MKPRYIIRLNWTEEVLKQKSLEVTHQGSILGAKKVASKLEDTIYNHLMSSPRHINKRIRLTIKTDDGIVWVNAKGRWDEK